MRLYEAVAIIMVGTLGLLFVVRRTKASFMPRIAEDRLPIWVTIASPLIVAIVVTLGLAFLGAENLAGGAINRDFQVDHSTVIQNLFFRH